MDIQHDEARSRFFAVIDGHEAYIEYERKGDALDFKHTFVPPELRGQAVAGKLVAFGFDHVKQAGLKVIPTCSYVAKKVERTPEYKELTAG